MDKIEIIPQIGNIICDECGPNRGCGLELEDCERIDCAIEILEDFISSQNNN